MRVGDAGDAPHGLLHGDPLAVEAGVVDPGAPPDPRRRLAAGQGGGDRRRRRRVADAHLADHQQVTVETVDGGDGGVDDLVEALRFEGGLEPDVVRRLADPDVDGDDGGTDLAGERVDRRAAVAVGVEHRRRDVGGIGAHRLGGGDAVVGGEDQPDRPLDPRPVGALPPGDPLGELVEPRQRAARAQDLGRSLVDRGGARRVGPGQVVEQVVEAGGHSNVQGSVRGMARPATSSSAVSAAAAQRWLTRPSRSR